MSNIMNKGGLIARLLSCFLILSVALTSCKNSATEDLIELLPVQLEEDGNWSFLAPDGTIKYENEFKNWPSAVVNGHFSVEEKDGLTFYKAGDKPEPVKGCEGLKSVGYLNDGLVPIVREKSRITLVDANGKEAFTLNPIGGKEVVACTPGYSNGLLQIQIESGEWGLVDTKGKVVVKPAYTGLYNLKDGRSVVLKDSVISIIDKKGETVYKLKKDWELEAFNEKYFVVKDANDHILFVNENGETQKCPAKVKSVSGFNESYYVFYDGENYGVMSRKDDDVIVRAKYNSIILGPDNTFICSDDKGTYFINSKGEITKELDPYEFVFWRENFGLFAKEKKTWVLLNDKGEVRKGCEFYDLATNLSKSDKITSEYLNLNQMAQKVVEKLTTDGYANLKFGMHPKNILSEQKNYLHKQWATIDNLNYKSNLFGFEVKVHFNGNIASTEYIYFADYSYDYWNEVDLDIISICVTAYSSLGVEAIKALIGAAEKKGFKLDSSDYKNGLGWAILASDKSGLVISNLYNNGQLSMGLIRNASFDKGEWENYFTKELEEAINSSKSEKDDDVVAVEDTAAVADEII
ncbi:MAG: WG repeat-containing protein [Bacteroides sp.]|nr:WG repeat-containing protein [Bacteroides sp.]